MNEAEALDLQRTRIVLRAQPGENTHVAAVRLNRYASVLEGRFGVLGVRDDRSPREYAEDAFAREVAAGAAEFDALSTLTVAQVESVVRLVALANVDGIMSGGRRAGLVSRAIAEANEA